MPKKRMSSYQAHKQKWEDCELCLLYDQRTRMVFARGKLPCDVLFVGEAPGMSEDVLGKPFVGPAGKLLDSMIGNALNGREITYALTNLVCCFPREAKGKGEHEPPVEAIRACSERLIEFYRIANPSVVVCVGGLAKKWVPKILGDDIGGTHLADIVHPAAILRADVTQKGLAIQRATVTLSDAFDEVVPF